MLKKIYLALFCLTLLIITGCTKEPTRPEGYYFAYHTQDQFLPDGRKIFSAGDIDCVYILVRPMEKPEQYLIIYGAFQADFQEFSESARTIVTLDPNTGKLYHNDPQHPLKMHFSSDYQTLEETDEHLFVYRKSADPQKELDFIRKRRYGISI